MFKKLKGKLKGDDHPAPAGPQKQQPGPSPPSYQQSDLHPSNPYYAPPPNQQTTHNIPPSEKYQPPPGPPPNPNPSTSSYAPPPNPPPPHASFPNQPPPTWSPPPYHDWTVIPDTALLPPPPSIGYDASPTANATEEDGERADQWCVANPLWGPQNLAPAVHAAIQNAQLALLKPPHLPADVFPMREAGHWKVRTARGARDAALLTNLPAYSVGWDSPLRTGVSKTIYFEVGVVGVGIGGSGGMSFEEADAGIALGFVAPPFPMFRLPGWQRGSLGVHGDDGRKYVNDTWGGVDFTSAFQEGERVGVGMRFGVPRGPPGYGEEGKALDIEVFFTRDGKREGGWDGNEELDERCEGGNVGLRGECDLFPAVGVFGGVDFEVFFHPSQWLYRPG